MSEVFEEISMMKCRYRGAVGMYFIYSPKISGYHSYYSRIYTSRIKLVHVVYPWAVWPCLYLGFEVSLPAIAAGKFQTCAHPL